MSSRSRVNKPQLLVHTVYSLNTYTAFSARALNDFPEIFRNSVRMLFILSGISLGRPY